EMLLIIRGQKILKLKKMDYTEHPDSRYLKLEKTENFIPEWYQKMQKEKISFEEADPEQERSLRVKAEEEKQEEEMMTLQEELTKKKPEKKAGDSASVFKVEDLFG